MSGKLSSFIDVPDYCSLTGTSLLKARLEAYWLAQGLEGVKIDVYSIDGTDMYSVKSNIAELLTVRMRNVYSAGDE